MACLKIAFFLNDKELSSKLSSHINLSEYEIVEEVLYEENHIAIPPYSKLVVTDINSMNEFTQNVKNSLFCSKDYFLFLNTSLSEIKSNFKEIDLSRIDFLTPEYKINEVSSRIQLLSEKVSNENRNQDIDYSNSFFRNAVDGFIVMTLSGYVLEANDSFCEILEWSREELLNKSISNIDANHNERSFAKFWKSKPLNKQYILESMHLTKSGKQIPVKVCTWKESKTEETLIFGIVKFNTNSRKDDIEIIENDFKYRKMFEENSSIMLLINPLTGEINDANDSAVEFYGYEYEELTSKTIYDINMLSQEEVRNEMQKARSGNKKKFVFKHLTANNEIKDVTVFSNRIKIKGQELLYSIIHDVTKEIKAEQALIKAKETAELYLDMAGSFFVNIDKYENITMINQKALEILGYERSEVIGKNWFDLCIRDIERPVIRKIFRSIVNGEIEHNDRYENVIVTKDGKIRTISWQNTYIKDDNDNITSVLSSGIDITHRIEAERTLKENEDLLRTLVENQEDAIVMINNDFDFLFVNPSAANLFDFSIDSMKGKKISDFFTPRDIDILTSNIDRMILMGKSSFEIPLYKYDRTIPLLVTITPRKNKEGKLTGIYLVLRDFSEQKEILRRLENQKKIKPDLIPICASCFKIRSEESKWQSPSDFLSQKVPELKFTHSICPDCQKKLYPNINFPDI